MGMTIDEAKEWLKIAVPIKALTQEEFETFIQAVNLAADTMRKYQKIEQIINNAKDSDGAVKYNWLYEQISEVIEDESSQSK